MHIRYYGDKLSKRIAKTPEGFLICQDVPISRTGYQEYLASELTDNPIKSDKIIAVYRPAEEVFDLRALASFEGKPVTNEHPNEDVTPQNYQTYACGHVQNVHAGEGEDSDKVLADLYITDPDLIDSIMSGKREVSCGYYAEEKRDSSGKLCQTRIRGNHVAVVNNGRAGNKVCIRDKNSLDGRNFDMRKSLTNYIEGLRYLDADDIMDSEFEDDELLDTQYQDDELEDEDPLMDEEFVGDDDYLDDDYLDEDEVVEDDEYVDIQDDYALEDEDEFIGDDDYLDDDLMTDDDYLDEDELQDEDFDDDDLIGDDDYLDDELMADDDYLDDELEDEDPMMDDDLIGDDDYLDDDYLDDDLMADDDYLDDDLEDEDPLMDDEFIGDDDLMADDDFEDDDILSDDDFIGDEEFIGDEDPLMDDEFIDDDLLGDDDFMTDEEIMDACHEDDDLMDGCHGDEDPMMDDDVLSDEDPIMDDEEPVIDTDPMEDDSEKTAALKEIAGVAKDIKDPEQRKKVQDTVYRALSCNSQMKDIMRITQQNIRNRASQSNVVDYNKQQAIYDSFNPHK